MEVFFVVFHTSPLVWVGAFMLRKEPRYTEASHINIQSPKNTSQHIKFSHKKKYCGIKDIRVLFYSSIFQVIIVFPFIVLKYISFCCHSSHSDFCCNRLVYSCFVLIVKSDSNFNLNFSCQLSILFNLFVTHLCLQPVFIPLLFLFQIVFCFMHSVFPVTLFFSLCLSSYFVFMLLCLFHYFVLSHSVFSVTLSLCHSFFPLILSLCHFVFFCYSVFFHLFVALPFPFFSLIFRLIFTLSSVYFLIFLREYLSI